MSALNIRVGASVDRSLNVAFQPLIDSAKRAKTAIEAESKQSGRAISKGVKKGTDEAEAAFAKLVAEIEGKSDKAFYHAGKAAKDFGREAKTNFDSVRRNFDAMAKSADKSLDALARKKTFTIGGALRELARRGAGHIAGTMPGIGLATAGQYGLAGAKRAAYAAMGITASLARGAGVELDAGTIARKNFDLEKLAQDVSNNSFIAGDKRNGRRVDKREIIDEAFRVGEKTGTDANSAIEGLAKFVSKTGDLRSGRDILEQMAVYAKASGSSLDDMLDAAGDVSNALGDVENKGETIKTIMRAFSGQGKLGAIEIRHLSAQMAKIGAASRSFEGGAQSIVQMGVLAQGARAGGGASSAQAATTSVMAFTQLFSKSARLDAFKKMGVDINGADNKIKSPKQLIVDMLKATEQRVGITDASKWNKTFGSMVYDSKARTITRGYEDIYKKAGGGEEGVKKVIEEFERLENAIISEEEVMDSFKRAMKTSKSQAEVFNNSIQRSAMQMQQALLPAMAQLAAAIVPVVQQLAAYVSVAAGDQQLANVQEAATDDVAAAVKNTDKAMKGGKISDAHVEELRIASNEAREAKYRAQAELKDAEEMLARKKAGKDKSESFWALGSIENKSDDPNSFWGRVFGTSQKGDEKRIQEKQEALKKAEETYKQALDQNKKIEEAIKGELVVRVKNIDDLKSALGPPGVNTGGTGETPEQKLGK